MAILGVDDFKSKLRGGGARPNLFKATVNFPGMAVEMLNSLRSSVKEAHNYRKPVMNVIEVPFRGRQLKIAGDRTFERLDCHCSKRYRL